MDEFVAPGEVTVPDEMNLTDPMLDNAAEHPDTVSFARKVGGSWTPVTAKDFAEQVRGLAAGLIASGVGPGERVALMSATRYEWTLLDYAIWTAGGVTVPVYETSSAEQLQWILSDSGAVAAFLETAAHRATYERIAGEVPGVRQVWGIDTGELDELARRGASVPEADIDERRRGVRADDLATIIYTSGTTGRPKGCELTHRNFLFYSMSVASGLRELFHPEESTLLFLPLAHSFARIIQLGCVLNRVRLAHSSDIANLLPDLASFQPTFLLAVPRVFEKVYNTAAQRARADGKGAVFDMAERTAIAYSQALDRGRPGPLLRVRHALFDRLVYAKLRGALGGRVRYAVSGGAPLGARLGHFFRGVGVTVLEGYGLTETAAGGTVNLPDAVRIGTVGRPIPGVRVRIASDGEVLIGGDIVFRGYRHNPEATREALSDGFMRTGDLGSLDDDGYLTITGRKKELIVTAGGKNVSPAQLEDRVRAHPLVSQCVVVGDGRPFVAALVTLDEEAVAGWLAAHGRPAGTPAADLVDDPQVRADIQSAVDDANRAVSRAEGIRNFAILPRDFTVEGGELTPSLKVKRSVVAKECAEAVEALYHR